MDKQQIHDIIAKNLSVGFTIVDRDGFIIDFNPAAEKITGYSKDEVIGKSHLEILHDASNKEACPLFQHTLRKHKHTVATEAVIKNKNGEFRTITVSTSPLFDRDNNFIGGVELFRDITEFKKIEKERKNLLSMFIHDMKNPVMTARGFLSRLISGKAGPLTETQQNHLEIIGNDLVKLEELIKGFLEFSKFESKEFKPVPNQYNITKALFDHIENIKVEAEKKNIQILFEYFSSIPIIIHADASMINRVITNLLDNAIKYTNQGGVVTVKLSDKNRYALVEVIDTGPGIPKEHLPYIFAAFYQVGRGSQGSGLGLSIAKKIIEAHDGKILVESTPEKGTTFRFTLPKPLIHERTESTSS